MHWGNRDAGQKIKILFIEQCLEIKQKSSRVYFQIICFLRVGVVPQLRDVSEFLKGNTNSFIFMNLFQRINISFVKQWLKTVASL